MVENIEDHARTDVPPANFTVRQRALHGRCLTVKVPAESGPAAVASNIDVPSTSDAGTMWATRVPTTICCHPDALAAGLALSVRAAPPGPLRARLAAEHARRRTAVAGEIQGLSSTPARNTPFTT